jgi:hypothetical protein
LLNKLTVIALLLSVSLLSGCNKTTGSGNSEIGMQSNATPTNTNTNTNTNTTSIPTAMAKNSPPAAGDPVRVARWSQSEHRVGMDVMLTGTLAIFNNCLVATTLDSSPMLLIFPYGVGVWDDAKQTLTLDGKVMRIGETIRLRGGPLTSFDLIKEGRQKYYDPDCGIKDLWLAS